MRAALLALVVACSSSAQPGPTEPTGPTAPPDTRTAIEKRRDAACEQVGAKATACAAEDTKRDFEAGKVSKKQYDEDTNPRVIRKNTEVYVEKCKHDQMSSRQVRVMEVCMREETECGPWQSCIANMQPQKSP